MVMKRNNRTKTLNRIHKMMERLETDTSLSEIEAFLLQEKTYKTIEQYRPEYLYRFRSPNPNNIDSFINDKVYLATPYQLNDLADCLAYINPALKTKKKYYFEGPIKYDNPIADLERLVDFSNKVRSVIETIRNSVKIACFCEEVTVHSMWAHYADSHKGFALRYRVKDIQIDDCISCSLNHRGSWTSFYPVFYVNERNDIADYAFIRTVALQQHDYDTQEFPIPYLPLLEKDKEQWENEKEWRIICRDTSKSFIGLKPDAIFLGYNMEDSVRTELENIARVKDMMIFGTRFDDFSSKYKMEVFEY